MNKNSKLFHLIQFRWLFLTGCIAVISSEMAFGLVASIAFGMTKDTALWMLAVIPPVSLATGLSTWATLRTVRRKMERLLDGIQAVAGGDLTVCLDTRGAAEYAPIYDNFNRMVRELRVTKEEMVSFTNDFSHEFKTPITSILGFAEYLIETGRDIESPERMQYLQVIAGESRRLSELAQKTLLLSKVDACQILTDKTDFNLSEQLRHCAILLLPQIEKKRIQLEMDIPELTCCGNAELLEQVWLNLLNNAIKFTPDGGIITLTAAQSDTAITIRITDTGVGMEPEIQAHIFERYYQHDSVHTFRGSGIGLAIVHRIISISGGSVTVRSAPGAGSTFSVTLPV